MKENLQSLFDLSRGLFLEDEERRKNADSKASTLLSVLSISIASLGFSAKWIFKENFSTSTFLEFVVYTLLTTTFVLLSTSWFYVFVSLKNSDRDQFILKKSDLDIFKDNEIEAINYTLAKKYIISTQKNVSITNLKIEKLQRGYRFLKYSIIGIILLFICYPINLMFFASEKEKKNEANPFLLITIEDERSSKPRQPI